MEKIKAILQKPRIIFAAISIICFSMLAFGIIYLQNILELEPCPMCIVQRYCMIFLCIFCAIAAIGKQKILQIIMGVLSILAAGFGAFTAANQSWLQWNPPEFPTCGRDLYGMIESFPIQKAIPMIFRGSGDCSAVDWTFLSLTIANWAFIWFIIFIVVIFTTLIINRKR